MSLRSVVVAVVTLLALPALAAEKAAYLVLNARMKSASEANARPTMNASPVDLLWGRHLLEPGAGAVLVIRQLREAPGVDAGRFTFLTAEVPLQSAQEAIRLPTAGMSFYFSSGAAAWISKGTGVYASSADGTIVFKKNADGHAQVDVRISMVAHSASAIFSYPDERRCYSETHDLRVLELTIAADTLPGVGR